MAETKCGFGDTPTITGRALLTSTGPTLLVDIGFDPAWRAAGSPRTVPQAAIQSVWALVDTGAGESCIDDQLAVRLGLPLIDRRPIAGISGLKTANMYMAQIHVSALGFTMYGAFAGVDLVAGGLRHQALIGRTFLQHLTMVYSGPTGDVTLRT
jgi:predicted aspartyl protease